MALSRKPPLSEPLGLVEAKAHLRVQHDLEDELIQSLISAARERTEVVTRRAIARSVWTLHLRRPAQVIELPRPPVVELVRLEYDDAEGRTIVWQPDSLRLDRASAPGILYIYDPPPADIAPAPGAFRVIYEAGYTAETLPRSIAQAMLLMIGHWYAHREAVGTPMAELPMAVRALLSGHRVDVYR